MHAVSIPLAQVLEYWLFTQPIGNVLDREPAERDHRPNRESQIVQWNNGEGHGACSPADDLDAGTPIFVEPLLDLSEIWPPCLEVMFSVGKPSGLFGRGAILSLQIPQEKRLDVLCLIPCNLEGIELAFDYLSL